MRYSMTSDLPEPILTRVRGKGGQQGTCQAAHDSCQAMSHAHTRCIMGAHTSTRARLENEMRTGGINDECLYFISES